MKPLWRDDLQVRKVGDEVVVLDRRNGLIHQLNGTAGFVWSRCDGSVTVEVIAASLAEEYGLDREQARQDVEAAIGKFSKLGLLTDTATFTSE